jgi:hypothetical protein
MLRARGKKHLSEGRLITSPVSVVEVGCFTEGFHISGRRLIITDRRAVCARHTGQRAGTSACTTPRVDPYCKLDWTRCEHRGRDI